VLLDADRLGAVAGRVGAPQRRDAMPGAYVMTGHVPARPGWLRVACSEPWPCRIRRQDLLIEYSIARVALSMLMSVYLVDALEDLAEVRAGELHRRFLGWARDRPTL